MAKVAESGERFRDFGPFVPSINDAGVVAFQATLAGGESGVFVCDGSGVREVVSSAGGRFAEIVSHPDIGVGGDVCFYATLAGGGRGVFVVRGGVCEQAWDSHGPLGPTMAGGHLAFRACDDSGSEAVFVVSARGVRKAAEVGAQFAGFQGLPVVNSRGEMLFRVDLAAGRHRICIDRGGVIEVVAETGDEFASLANFPMLAEDGAAAFCGSLARGGSGVFVVGGGRREVLVDSSHGFESFRGVLVNSRGLVVFYGTPVGGTLGIYAGVDPHAGRVLGIGDAWMGSTIREFALNPVSVNEAGQFAVRLLLEDGRGMIVRGDPAW